MKRIFSMKSIQYPENSGFQVDKTLTIKEYTNFNNFLIEINTYLKEMNNLKIEPFQTNLNGLETLRNAIDKILIKGKQ
jgi:hypothetical protein